ncbi:toxin HipA [Subsaximicrobium wynnwilliamsii]|jgi:serine/threonine-protein kinase HipA|uniref:Toxin HipA n=1 Tax=Subsaximicrobium wynnwilliamsii TaxID=291179 RepID=A0A5C6ZCI1_9FLAO|nr:HipA N-terminal domain-containing protein [Subsaximicrobium wynnwilliamsii]TXD81408.1 toxin HipA [Subsaximicrobium wynnwilliamsii]TXD87124.1 toxin HipA [Subsaximicrobium wynnwilliamsii]TXE00678.1 toxin HipA [Subsaximicrobium wynnwilliamsii]
MRRAIVFVHGKRAGILTELSANDYSFNYDEHYESAAVSLTMPTSHKKYSYKSFPPFFEGLLPEGVMLEGLLRIGKIDKKDYFSQLIATGNDLVGSVTVKLSDNE